MDYQSHIESIKRKFPDRDFLSLDEIAPILAGNSKAVRSLIVRGGLPKAEKRDSIIGCTPTQLAEFLAEADSQSDSGKRKSRNAPATLSILKPRPDADSLSAMILSARLQSEFADGLATILEAIELREKIGRSSERSHEPL